MIDIDSERYFSILNRIINSNDMYSIVNEYKGDKGFLYSVLTDVLMGDKSPNSQFIKKFTLKTKINDDYLIERVTLLVSYIKPKKYNDDYYEILKVNPDSTQEEIREKWIELAKEYHPDKIGDLGLEKIKKINEAYEVIGDKDKRLEHDSNYLNEIPVHVSSSKTILPIKYVVYASTVVIFVLISFFIKSVFFTGNDNEIKIAKIYEDSNVNESYQTKNNIDKANKQSPEDVNIEELSDFSDISGVRKKRINEYLKNSRQTSSLVPDTQSLTPNPSSPNTESRVPKTELPKTELPSNEHQLQALNKRINELEKAGDFKVVIVKRESSIHDKDPGSSPSNLATDTELPITEPPSTELPKTEQPIAESPNPELTKTESRVPNPEPIDPKLLALDKKINELEKAGDFKVVIVKSNPSESNENKEAVVAKSLTPKTSNLAPDTQPLTPNPSSPNTDLLKSEIPKSEIRNTDIPNPSAPITDLLKPESPKTQPPKTEIHTVKSGDTLWKIARKNDTHVKDIIELNKLKGNKLKLGQKLIIPSGLDSSKQLIAKSPNNSSLTPNPSSLKPEFRVPSIETYTVKSGDNLWTIAKKYDIRVKNITAANNLRNNKIKIGQKLIIPSGLDSSRQLIAKSPNTSNLAPSTSLLKSKTSKSEIRNPEIKTVYDFISDYISAYKLGDLNRIKMMFNNNATENGVSIAKALASYNDIFNNKKIIKYDILIERINIKSEKSYIDGDFIITFKNLDKGNTKTSKGSINWVLDWKNDSWKIDQLNYQLKDTIFK